MNKNSDVDTRRDLPRMVDERIGAFCADDEARSLSAVLQTVRSSFPRGAVSIYDAGGGHRPKSAPWFDRSVVTVVDLSPPNGSAGSPGTRYVEGDIRLYCPTDETFDLIVCYNVLEHVCGPQQAIDNFCKLSAPNGLIFVASPCFWSINALVAKATPHWFHVWFYKRILNKPLAGTPGKAPFKTHHSRLIDPDNLASYLSSRGFEIVYRKTYSNNHVIKILREDTVASRMLMTLIAAMNALVLGRRHFGKGDFHLVARRKS